MRPRYEIKSTTQDGKVSWYWRLVAGNNEIVCSSHPQTFEFPTDARAAATQARRISRLAKVLR